MNGPTNVTPFLRNHKPLPVNEDDSEIAFLKFQLSHTETILELQTTSNAVLQKKVTELTQLIDQLQGQVASQAALVDQMRHILMENQDREKIYKEFVSDYAKAALENPLLLTPLGLQQEKEVSYEDVCQRIEAIMNIVAKHKELDPATFELVVPDGKSLPNEPQKTLIGETKAWFQWSVEKLNKTEIPYKTEILKLYQLSKSKVFGDK
jgi:hypothetical protein